MHVLPAKHEHTISGELSATYLGRAFCSRDQIVRSITPIPLQLLQSERRANLTFEIERRSGVATRVGSSNQNVRATRAWPRRPNFYCAHPLLGGKKRFTNTA